MQEITISKLQDYAESLNRLKEYAREACNSNYDDLNVGKFIAYQEMLTLFNILFASELQEEL